MNWIGGGVKKSTRARNISQSTFYCSTAAIRIGRDFHFYRKSLSRQNNLGAKCDNKKMVRRCSIVSLVLSSNILHFVSQIESFVERSCKYAGRKQQRWGKGGNESGADEDRGQTLKIKQIFWLQMCNTLSGEWNIRCVCDHVSH